MIIVENLTFLNAKKYFDNKITNYKGDSRILLTSNIIKKIKKGVSKQYKIKNLKRYHYIEHVLHSTRISVNKNKTMKILWKKDI